MNKVLRFRLASPDDFKADVQSKLYALDALRTSVSGVIAQINSILIQDALDQETLRKLTIEPKTKQLQSFFYKEIKKIEAWQLKGMPFFYKEQGERIHAHFNKLIQQLEIFKTTENTIEEALWFEGLASQIMAWSAIQNQRETDFDHSSFRDLYERVRNF